MATFACETCGLELSSKHAVESHVNRKYKCVPPGQVQYECRTCDKHFTRKNLLDQHLRTDKHRQVVAAVEAAEGAGSNSLVASESLDKSGLNIDSHNTTINNTDVRIRPRSFGRANVDHLVRLTYEELREALDLREKCGLALFLRLFKLLHLNSEAPRNHNALVDIDRVRGIWLNRKFNAVVEAGGNWQQISIGRVRRLKWGLQQGSSAICCLCHVSTPAMMQERVTAMIWRRNRTHPTLSQTLHCSAHASIIVDHCSDVFLHLC